MILTKPFFEQSTGASRERVGFHQGEQKSDSHLALVGWLLCWNLLDSRALIGNSCTGFNGGGRKNQYSFCLVHTFRNLDLGMTNLNFWLYVLYWMKKVFSTTRVEYPMLSTCFLMLYAWVGSLVICWLNK